MYCSVRFVLKIKEILDLQCIFVINENNSYVNAKVCTIEKQGFCTCFNLSSQLFLSGGRNVIVSVKGYSLYNWLDGFQIIVKS